MKYTFVLILSVSLFIPIISHAESCSAYGETFYCDNGSTYSLYNNTLYDEHGQTWSVYGAAVYGKDKTYSRYGDTLYDNQGNSWSQYGSSIYRPDGSTCSWYAGTLYCPQDSNNSLPNHDQDSQSAILLNYGLESGRDK